MEEMDPSFVVKKKLPTAAIPKAEKKHAAALFPALFFPSSRCMTPVKLVNIFNDNYY